MQTPEEFETSVRALARQLYSDALSIERGAQFGRERDAIIELNNQIIILECTTSEKLEKVKKDAAKIHDLMLHFDKNDDRPTRGMIVTRSDATKDQIEEVQKYNGRIKIYSYNELRRKLVDAHLYLSLRIKQRFGSYEDYVNKKEIFDDSIYVKPTIFSDIKKTSISYDHLLRTAESDFGSTTVLTADYGVGKSSLFASLFFDLRRSYLRERTHRFPVFLNLNEFRGSKEPDLVLIEHARRVGLSDPASLVRAWRTGVAVLFLDGFDELGALSATASIERINAFRRNSVELVANFIKQSSSDTTIFISGRKFFFGTNEELYDSLCLINNFEHFTIEDFNEDQVQAYLSKIGHQYFIPKWLPPRPFLIATIVASLARDAKANKELLERSKGWDFLLDRISEREARQDTRLESYSVRKIINRLASRARRTDDGLGRFSNQEISEDFQAILGIPPDQDLQRLILRFPGTRPHVDGEGVRTFGDREFAFAARAGDVIEVLEAGGILDDDLHRVLGSATELISEITVELIAGRLRGNFKKGAILEFKKQFERKIPQCIQNEIFLASVFAFGDPSRSTLILNAEIENLDIDENFSGCRNLHFEGCVIQNLSIDADLLLSDLPTFSQCAIGELSGVRDAEIFKKNNTVDREVKKIISTKSLVESSRSAAIGVFLSVIKKVFIQSGSGRRREALYRGLDNSQRALVDEIVRILIRHDAVINAIGGDRDLIVPNRQLTARIRSIFFDPVGSTDSILEEVRNLS